MGLCCPLLRHPHQSSEDVLAGLLATSPVSTAAATLASKRYPVATVRLRARWDGETARWLRPNFGPTTAPERDAPTHTTRYTWLDQGLPPWSRPQSVCAPLGRFYFQHPTFQAERATRAKRAPAQRERKGSEWRKVLRSKPGGWALARAFGASPCEDDCRCYAGAPLRASCDS